MSQRNKIGLNDDISTMKYKLAGQREAKKRWRYNRQADCANLAIGVLHVLQNFQPEVEKAMVYRDK